MFYFDHFRDDLTSAEAAALFKKAMQVVEISISSYCNRRCSYCPNSIVDRISSPKQMSDELFINILRNLCRIDYSGRISIHRYNEPLADRAYAMKRIREIRALVPEAKIQIYTNGDYLDRSFVAELVETGVWRIVTTIHEAPNGTKYGDLLENQVRFLNRIALPVKGVSDTGGGRWVQVETGAPTDFLVWAQDFHARDANGVLFMQDRGGSLDVERGSVRSSPCFMPFDQLQIEWDGQMLPCCQIQPDAHETNKYTLGRLTPSSDVFLEWTNANYVRWRKDLFSYEPKAAPCSTCSFGGFPADTLETRARVALWRKMLELDAPAPVAEALCA